MAGLGNLQTLTYHFFTLTTGVSLQYGPFWSMEDCLCCLGFKLWAIDQQPSCILTDICASFSKEWGMRGPSGLDTDYPPN